MSHHPDKSPHSRSGRFLRRLLIVTAILLAIETPLLLSHARHAYFTIDGWFAFYGILGLAASAALVFPARALARLLRRDENHYGDISEESLPEDLDEPLR